jgi:hypothetical protein
MRTNKVNIWFEVVVLNQQGYVKIKETQILMLILPPPLFIIILIRCCFLH